MGPCLRTHLRAPPPTSSLYVMIHTILLLLVNIVLFRLEHQHRRKVRVSKQGTNAGNDVSIVNFTYLVVSYDLMTFKGWPPG